MRQKQLKNSWDRASTTLSPLSLHYYYALFAFTTSLLRSLLLHLFLTMLSPPSLLSHYALSSFSNFTPRSLLLRYFLMIYSCCILLYCIALHLYCIVLYCTYLQQYQLNSERKAIAVTHERVWRT